MTPTSHQLRNGFLGEIEKAPCFHKVLKIISIHILYFNVFEADAQATSRRYLTLFDANRITYSLFHESGALLPFPPLHYNFIQLRFVSQGIQVGIECELSGILYILHTQNPTKIFFLRSSAKANPSETIHPAPARRTTSQGGCIEVRPY